MRIRLWIRNKAIHCFYILFVLGCLQIGYYLQKALLSNINQIYIEIICNIIRKQNIALLETMLVEIVLFQYLQKFMPFLTEVPISGGFLC